MVNELAATDPKSFLKLITEGDCSKLSEEQQIQYYIFRCENAGLDPRTSPLQYIKLGGKLVLYALKAATEQLTSNRKITLEIRDQRTEGESRVVTVRATLPTGQFVDEVGSVPIAKLGGENLTNAYMKCVTKAKRRAVLSICGLGLMDETEVESLTPAEKKERKEEEKRLSNDRVTQRLDAAHEFFAGTAINVTPTEEEKKELIETAKKFDEKYKGTESSDKSKVPF